MKPITRIDYYLATITNDEDAVTPLPEPITRIDFYLAKLAGENIAELPEPVTRIDFYLAALCGMDVVIPDEPVTRIDFYLAALNGETVDLPDAVTRIDYYLNNWAESGLPWTTFTGNPLQFNAPKAHTLRSTTVEFEPKQDLHGYDNPWPAGATKNILKPTANTMTDNDVKFTVNADGTVVANGTASANALLVYGEFDVVSGENYTYSGLPSEGSNSTYSIQIMRGSTAIDASTTLNKSYIATATETLQIRLVVRNGYTANNLKFSPMVRLSSEAAGYIPYSNICPISGWTGMEIYRSGEDTSDYTTYSVTWQDEAGTVYGGTIDLTTGVLTVDRTYLSLDNTNDWQEYATGIFLVSNVTTDAAGGAATPQSVIDKYISNQYPFIGNGRTQSSQITTDKHFYGQNNYKRIWVYDSQYLTLDAFKTALASNPLQVVYPLATPITYQLTPTQIDALLGINTMWTDGSNLTVEARGEAVNLNALQSLNMLLGGRYVNNHTEDDLSDEEALDVILGGQR